MLFILLIGMISLTAFSFTPEPEQKSKSTFEQSAMTTDMVSVIFDVQTVAVTNSITHLNAVIDVGWPISLTKAIEAGTVKVYNLKGEKLNIPYKDLPKGMYIVTVINDGIRKQHLIYKAEDPVTLPDRTAHPDRT